MKKTFFLVLLTAVTLASSACFIRPRNDIHTHTFSVPGIASPECGKLILDLLGKIAGIKEVAPHPEDGTLTVSFDSGITALKNIEFALAEAGFDVDASVGRAAAKARLPEGCR